MNPASIVISSAESVFTTALRMSSFVGSDGCGRVRPRHGGNPACLAGGHMKKMLFGALGASPGSSPERAPWRRLRPALPQSMMPSPERILELGIISAPSTAWELVDFGMNDVAPTAYTDAAARVIMAMQSPDGSWSGNESRRPPMNAGDFHAAAVCIFALKHYGPKGMDARTSQAIANGVSWLAHTSKAVSPMAVISSSRRQAPRGPRWRGGLHAFDTRDTATGALITTREWPTGRARTEPSLANELQ
jgi:hypothetical protein